MLAASLSHLLVFPPWLEPTVAEGLAPGHRSTARKYARGDGCLMMMMMMRMMMIIIIIYYYYFYHFYYYYYYYYYLWLSMIIVVIITAAISKTHTQELAGSITTIIWGCRKTGTPQFHVSSWFSILKIVVRGVYIGIHHFQTAPYNVYEFALSVQSPCSFLLIWRWWYW